MKRIAFMLTVRPEKLDEYRQVHKNVWPEMLDALEAAGWHNYSLFLSRDGHLFGYFETPKDFETAKEMMAEKEVNERWQAQMAQYFESADGDETHADDMMIELEEVFHLS
jgi:L-rhamnose mutarotase